MRITLVKGFSIGGAVNLTHVTCLCYTEIS